MAQKTELTTNQRRAIAALLACSSVESAARQCKLTPRTLYNYLRNTTFKAELRARQDETIAAASAALAGLAGEAIGTLRDVLKDDSATHASQVRAALGILQERRRIGELDDLADRVTRLEQLEGKKHGH